MKDLINALPTAERDKALLLLDEQLRVQNEWENHAPDSPRAAKLCKRDGAITWELREILNLNQ